MYILYFCKINLTWNLNKVSNIDRQGKFFFIVVENNIEKKN